MHTGLNSLIWNVPVRLTLSKLLYAVLLFFISIPVYSQNILIIVDSNSKSQNTFLEHLQHSENLNNTQFTVQSRESLNLQSIQQKSYDLIITVGTNNALALSKVDTHSLPILNALIPTRAFKNINYRNKNVSAIFIDQPVERRLNLIRQALPTYKRIGIITSKESLDIVNTIKNNLQNTEEIVHIELDEEQNLLHQFSQLFEKIDVLFTIADPLIYNRGSAKGILLSSYRNQVAVLGFSKNYVRAGALLSVHSSPEQIAQQTSEWIIQFEKSAAKQLPKLLYPEYFMVSVNRQVARSMNIHIDSEQNLAESLHSASGEKRD